MKEMIGKAKKRESKQEHEKVEKMVLSFDGLCNR
jgi:hypothetical protein